MAGSRRPLPLRLARVFLLVGTVLLVVLLLYVAAAVVYAAQVSNSGASGTTVKSATGNALEVSSGFNVSNPGPFSISHLTIESRLSLPDGTPWLAGHSAPVDIAGGGVGTVTLALRIPLDHLGPAEPLLVNDSTLPWKIWVNATYAHLVGVGLYANSTYHWGAPFYGLNVSFAGPARAPNGSLVEQVTLSFSNHSPVAFAGNLSLGVDSASGASCTSLHFPVNAPPHASYSQTESAELPSAGNCNPSGGSYTASWTGSGLSFDPPGGRIP